MGALGKENGEGNDMYDVSHNTHTDTNTHTITHRGYEAKAALVFAVVLEDFN